MKKLCLVLFLLCTFFTATIAFAYVMNGEGACSQCACSSFNAQKYGFPNKCKCGHWDSAHNR